MAYWTVIQVKIISPFKYYLILKSYLHSRYLLVKVEIEYTELSPVNAEVPQGSVLGRLPSANLTRNHYSDFCQRYRWNNDRQFSHCLTNYQPAYLQFNASSKIGEWKPRVLSWLASISPLKEKCVSWSTKTMYNFPKQKVGITKIYWLLRHKSHLTTSNKFLIYKATVKPIWTYRIQHLGMASTSNRNSGTYPVEDLAHDSGRTLVCAIYGYPKGSPNTNS
jgi:hypothetical protein